MYTFVVPKLTCRYHMERAPVPFTPAFYPAGSISLGNNLWQKTRNAEKHAANVEQQKD